ncbi:MAG: SLC13 family permease, partial [Gammaproteobacteria bacterium]
MSAERRATPFALWLGPALGLLVFLLVPEHYSGGTGTTLHLDLMGRAVVGIMAWMALWWLAEPVPLPVTSLLPALLFPLLGIAETGAALAPYADPLIFLFLGGFLLSSAVQKWDLHRVFAFRILALTGRDAGRLVAGVMGATAFISLWLSNTATAVLMLPVALSIADRPGVDTHLRKSLVLGVAYGATIGGMGTLIGTPPNLFVASFLGQHHDYELDFLHWSMFGLPIVACMLPFTWWVLTRWCFPLGQTHEIGLAAHQFESRPLDGGARRTLIVFVVAAGCWMFRALLVDLEIAGLRPLAALSDTGIALAAALALFLLGSGTREDDGRAPRLLDWDDAKSVPWGTLLLFGGGLCLAAAISATGVDRALGAVVAGVPALPAWMVIAVSAATVVCV